MLENDRINVSKGIDSNKTVGKRLMWVSVWHYWYFFRLNFQFQPKACDVCHNMTQKSMNIDDVAVLLWKDMIIELNFGSWLKMRLQIEWNKYYSDVNWYAIVYDWTTKVLRKKHRKVPKKGINYY